MTHCVLRQESGQHRPGDLLGDEVFSVAVLEVSVATLIGQFRLAKPALLNNRIFQQLLEALRVIGLDEISVKFTKKNQIYL